MPAGLPFAPANEYQTLSTLMMQGSWKFVEMTAPLGCCRLDGLARGLDWTRKGRGSDRRASTTDMFSKDMLETRTTKEKTERNEGE